MSTDDEMPVILRVLVELQIEVTDQDALEKLALAHLEARADELEAGEVDEIRTLIEEEPAASLGEMINPALLIAGIAGIDWQTAQVEVEYLDEEPADGDADEDSETALAY